MRWAGAGPDDFGRVKGVLSQLRQRQKRKRIKRALIESDINWLLSLRNDPDWSSPALFLSIDSLLGTGRLEELPRLQLLSEHAPPEDGAMYQVIRRHQENGAVEARALAEKLQKELDLPGVFTKWADTWLIFLNSYHHKLEAKGEIDLGPIIQYWDNSPPQDVISELDRWKALSKNRGYCRFNEQSGLEFLEEYFGSLEMKMFEEAPHPAVQSDLLRLCVLKVRGGIYIDADTKPSPHFEEFAKGFGTANLWFRTSQVHCRIQNGFLAFKPQHPFVDAMLAKTKARLSGNAYTSILDLSGPGMATDTLLEEAAMGRVKDISALPISQVHSQILRQFDASYKQDDRNWRIFQENRRTPPSK